MKSIAAFNALNGATVSRTEIEKIINTAKTEEQFEVATRLQPLLAFSDDLFKIEVGEPIKVVPAKPTKKVTKVVIQKAKPTKKKKVKSFDIRAKINIGKTPEAAEANPKDGELKPILNHNDRNKSLKCPNKNTTNIKPTNNNDKNAVEKSNYTSAGNNQVGLFGTAKNKETIAFNKQIILAKRNGFSDISIFKLGTTKNELLKIVGVNKILLSGSVIKKSMSEKSKNHCLKFEDFINLPDYINEPIAIFKSDTVKSGIVVLTEITNKLNKKVLVAFHINEHIKINDIRTIYSKDRLSIYKKWYNKGLLLYGNKKSDCFKLIVASIATKFKKPLSMHKYKNKSFNCPNKNVTILKPTNDSIKKPKAKPLNAPNEFINKNSLAYKRLQPQAAFEYYKIEDKDISEFLGNIEKKTKESVVITLAGGQGSMKTRMLFRLMAAFAKNYKCGHASIEEHPDSALYASKVDQYISDPQALHNITAPEVNSIVALQQLIEQNEVIFIDSFAKLQEIDSRFEVDKDLRKKYNGKLFVVIFQQTTDGKMRGGSKSQFDGDVILMTNAFADYRQNYVFANKNRYQNKPLDGLHYTIFDGKLTQPEPQPAPQEKHVFSFKTIQTN